MFVGIDWSGDKKSFQSGIAVATATVGVPSPVIVQRRWSRDSVVKWLCEQANERRILVGIDFAFAHPFVDRECYYPGFGRAPRTPCELWAFVDRVAAERPNFYAAEPIRDSEVGDWYQFQGRQNARYAWRLRGTENAAAQCKGVSPKNTFNAIGRSVAEGSLAGMRVLHYLHKEHRDLFRIWPMEDIVRENPPSSKFTPLSTGRRVNLRTANQRMNTSGMRYCPPKRFDTTRKKASVGIVNSAPTPKKKRAGYLVSLRSTPVGIESPTGAELRLSYCHRGIFRRVSGGKCPRPPPHGGHDSPSESRPAGAGDCGHFHSANAK